MKQFWKAAAKWLAAATVSVVCLALTVGSLMFLLTSDGAGAQKVSATPVDKRIMDAYDTKMSNSLSDAMQIDGVPMMEIEKVYWLNDDDPVAPEPDQSKFGSCAKASDMAPVLEEARELLGLGETVFSPDIEIKPKTEILYYLDETIFVVTWKQIINGGVYTFSEVKIKHPSQLRRYLAGGEFGSTIQLTTTDMASKVNAVVASSGDFYTYREQGVIVYDGVVQRVNAEQVDTCYVNEDGDLLLSYAGELTTLEEAQAFVEENRVRFSLAFGPVLVDKGEPVTVDNYYLLGQVRSEQARAAFCQKGELHYVVALVNMEPGYGQLARLPDFAKVIATLGVQTAYTLDGGQTAVIAMNDRLINRPVFGSQRNISDIFYFATAIPEGE